MSTSFDFRRLTPNPLNRAPHVDFSERLHELATNPPADLVQKLLILSAEIKHMQECYNENVELNWYNAELITGLEDISAEVWP